jgi:hypothetical protein
MRSYETLGHVTAQQEARVTHAKRIEDVPPKVTFQVLAGHCLDHLAYKIDTNTLFPPSAGIEQQRQTQGVVFAPEDAGQPSDLNVVS